MCNGVSDSCGLNGEGVAVCDAGGRCGICAIGFDILSGRDYFTVWISCLKETVLLETGITGTRIGESLVCI